MKSCSLGALSLLVCLMGIVPVLEAQTILNGDFENGKRHWSFRSGWSRDCKRVRFGRCSARYRTHRGRSTPIARQRFHIDRSGFCQLTVWMRTNLDDPPFWSDGEPTCTGLSVQLWNRTGRGPRVPLDLARQDVHRRGYRGQGGRRGWRKYVGRLAMPAGQWEVRLYMHAVRSRVGGRIRKIANAKGTAWVDGIELIRLR
ncbi:hypothetical protein [Candidatus Entotheonella palauensis]|uniref:hypothetical protein n=1 Tax=Candidatus Entotheonella palauensis TaxID=93172 RepID=UPI00117781F5|nr:hypothetical protein [Candidatus Entotheonella palauensis]